MLQTICGNLLQPYSQKGVSERSVKKQAEGDPNIGFHREVELLFGSTYGLTLTHPSKLIEFISNMINSSIIKRP